MSSKKRIDQVLDLLNEKLISDPLSKFRFNISTDPERIGLIEKGYGIVFPPSYRKFLEHFDGGMITEEPATYYQDMTDEEPDGIIDTSNSFYPLTKIHVEYENWFLDNILIEQDYDGLYPIIPIGQSTDKEIFFTLSQLVDQAEPPIFKCSSDKTTCSVISENFSEFLWSYIKHDGFPPLKDHKGIECNQQIDDHVTQFRESTVDDSNAGVKRCDALIKLTPNDAWYYNQRGLYYQDLDEMENATQDFNRAIDMDSENAYYWYCRGNFHLKNGNPKLALLDLDIAVRLKMQDPLYRYARAMALFELNFISKALMDCHMIQDQEPNSPLGWSLRNSIEEAMKLKDQEEHRERNSKKNRIKDS
jgi:tetratricopeptide (TPR) repeat protein